jgi:hypothetical protein
LICWNLLCSPLMKLTSTNRFRFGTHRIGFYPSCGPAWPIKPVELELPTVATGIVSGGKRSIPRAFFAPNPAANQSRDYGRWHSAARRPKRSHSSPSPGSFSGMEPYHQCVASVVPFATRQFRLSAGPIAVTSRLRAQLQADQANHRLDE